MAAKAAKKSTKAESVPRPTIKGKSRKEVVFMAWKKDAENATVEGLSTIVKGSIKDSTIRSWIGMWKNGYGFPKGHGPSKRPEAKTSKKGAK